MTTKELRLGNYVMKGSIYLYVDEIGEDYIDDYSLDVGGHSIDNIDGIPLTEKWLIKFGLIELKEATKRIKLETDFGDLMFYLDGRNKKFKYVHQFQNLYFALCGKELNIVK